MGDVDLMTEDGDDITVTSRDDDDVAAVVKRAGIPSPAFTILWSPHEPHRVGESAVLDGPRPWLFGRDDKEHVQLFAPRAPGRAVAGAPLTGDSISRRQVEVDFASDGGLSIKNIGKGAVRVNGERVERDADYPIARGDIVTIGGRYALLVGERPSEQRMQFPYPSAHVFGEADALGLVGESYAMWALRERLAAAADARTHVLVLGETGVGKELAARAVHRLGDRAQKTFLARNASTLDEGVFDAEIFGCVKDFPNAGSPERVGLVGAAEGGTLMLDEIGTISNALQAKLLTYLDAGSYFRVGDSRERHADVIVVGATNASVADLKNDLAPRFKMKIVVPPLAQRREDIPLLARHVVLKIAETSRGAQRFTMDVGGRREVRMSCALVTWLVQRNYPGNTRELEEVLRDAMFASAGDTIELELDPETPAVAAALDEEADDGLSEAAVREALEQCLGNQTRAAVMLGVTRHKIRRLMIKFEIGS